MLLQLALASSAAGREQPTEAYRFYLDGKAFEPTERILAGRADRLKPGDVISVNGIPLTLGSERTCRFRSAREGVLMELEDGRTRWVGVRVGPTYEEGLDFVDGLASLSKDEVASLWGVRAEVWTRACVQKAQWLNASRVFVSLGQSASEGHDDLPELPQGLRYLEAMRFVGWKRLADLRDLEFLDVLPERDFDVRLIESCGRLKSLRLISGELKHVEALANLPSLESLDIGHHPEVKSIEFARSHFRLRSIQIGGTAVSDLTPLSGLTQLEEVEANNTAVTRLPAGALPALRDLAVIGAPISDDAVAAFRQAHPTVRVRYRWNESLRAALVGATRIRLESGGSCGLGGPSEQPYESSEAGEIAGLLLLLDVNEQTSGAICGCLGGPSIEFFRGDVLAATVRLVCNGMLSWSGWPGHGELAPSDAFTLIEWLAGRGITGPRDEVREQHARMEASQRKTDRATAGMSVRLREVFEQEGQAAAREPGTYVYRAFPAALASEVPLPAERIRILLRILGASNDSWSGLDWQEQLADGLLRRHTHSELEAPCEAALLGTDRQLRRGAARFWDSWRSPLSEWRTGTTAPLRSAFLTVLQESRSPALRQRAMSRLLAWWIELPRAERERRLDAALHDPSEPVRRKAMVVAGQLSETRTEELLLRAMRGETMEIEALPPVPPDEMDDADLNVGDMVGRNAPVSDVAALALGYLRSRRAQPLIERAADEGSAMARVARALMDGRCDLLTGDDFRTRDNNQALQLAAVEAVVRCEGRHGLDLALRYETATHGWEADHVAAELSRMLVAAKAPGSEHLKQAPGLPQVRGWYQQYGTEYMRQTNPLR